MTAPAELQCVTCRKTYSDPAQIFSVLTRFEGLCVCWPCVNFYRKTDAPPAHGHGVDAIPIAGSQDHRPPT